MPNVPYIPGSDTSKDAAENLRTRLLVADAWINLAARPEGVTVREVERHTGLENSGPSVRQGELVQAGATMRDPGRRRERCGVYVLMPGVSVAEAKILYRRWVKSDGKPKRKGFPPKVIEACEDVADIMKNTDDEEMIGQAMLRLRDAIRREMGD